MLRDDAGYRAFVRPSKHMPTLRTYRLFICHDWEYSDDYARACTLLDSARNFDWENLSVPYHDPLDTNDELEYNLRNQIRPSDVLIVLAGMYTPHSFWMPWELRFAHRIGLPILGVAPYGNTRVPKAVRNAAWEVVGWRTNSIVEEVRRLAR